MNKKDKHKRTEVGKATYLEYEKYTELWSYNTLIARIYPEAKAIDLFPKHDLTMTTKRHLNRFFTEHFNAPRLGTGARRKEAIENGWARVGIERFTVRVNEE